MLSRKLKSERELKGVTQTDVAEFLNVTLGTYGNKENGHTEFTISEAKKLAEYFNIPVIKLFFEDLDNVKFTN